MKPATVIARRELSSYFCSPIAYVSLTLFLALSGFLFYQDFEPGRPAGMRNLFEWMVFILVFIIPVLSMGLLAQESSTGTMETMMTAPVGETDVVLGKFLGSLGFFLVLLAPTLIYVLVLIAVTTPKLDFGPIFSGYIGMILVGALFLSIGLFFSSLTKSQVVAAVASAAVLFLATIVPWWAQSETLRQFWKTVVSQTVFPRYTDFSRGVIDTGNIVFFLAGTVVFLFATVKVVESRRWK